MSRKVFFWFSSFVALHSASFALSPVVALPLPVTCISFIANTADLSISERKTLTAFIERRLTLPESMTAGRPIEISVYYQSKLTQAIRQSNPEKSMTDLAAIELAMRRRAVITTAIEGNNLADKKGLWQPTVQPRWVDDTERGKDVCLK